MRNHHGHARARSKLLAILIASSLAAAITLGGTAYLGRGILRGTIVPMAIFSVYKPLVDHRAHTDFRDVTPMLEQLGLPFHTGHGYNKDNDGCNVLGYERFRATYYCTNSRFSDSPDTADSFISQWNKQSPAFERSMLQHGWTKVWNDRQPINELFDPRHDTGAGVNYEKRRGQLWCTVSITRINAPDPADRHFFASETCEGYVELFGGY
jgi:hypothetical protein